MSAERAVERITVLRNNRRDPVAGNPWALVGSDGYAVIGCDSERGDYWLAATSTSDHMDRSFA